MQTGQIPQVLAGRKTRNRRGLSCCDPTNSGAGAVSGSLWLLGAVTLHGILLHHPRARKPLEQLENDGSATFGKLRAASQGWSWEKQNPSASLPPSPPSSFPSCLCFPFFIYSPLWGIIYTLNCRRAVNFPHFLQFVQAGFVLFTRDFLPWHFPTRPLQSLFQALPLKVDQFFRVSISFTPSLCT